MHSRNIQLIGASDPAYIEFLASLDSLEKMANCKLGEHPEAVTKLHPIFLEIKSYANVGIGALTASQAFTFPEWIPLLYQNNEVEQKMRSLATLLVGRRLYPDFNKKKYTEWDQKMCEIACDLLISDGYQGALTLKNSVIQSFTQGEWAALQGWRFQIHKTLIHWTKYELLAVEVPYGVPNPRTNAQGRADVLILGNQFIEYKAYQSSSKRKEKNVDLEQEGKIQQAFWGEFARYAGTARDQNISYGGINGSLTYVFSDTPLPGWIISGLKEEAQKARGVRPWAFPCGLKCNSQDILLPFDKPAYLTSCLTSWRDQYQLRGDKTTQGLRCVTGKLKQKLLVFSNAIDQEILTGQNLDEVFKQGKRLLVIEYNNCMKQFKMAFDALDALRQGYREDSSYWRIVYPKGNEVGLKQWKQKVNAILDYIELKVLYALEDDSVDTAIQEGRQLLANYERIVSETAKQEKTTDTDEEEMDVEGIDKEVQANRDWYY